MPKKQKDSKKVGEVYNFLGKHVAVWRDYKRTANNCFQLESSRRRPRHFLCFLNLCFTRDKVFYQEPACLYIVLWCNACNAHYGIAEDVVRACAPLVNVFVL